MLDPVAMGTAIQADLAAVGFNVEIKTFEWNAFLGDEIPGLEGKADMAMAWMTNDPDTLPYLAADGSLAGQGWLQFWLLFNPKVDELLEGAFLNRSGAYVSLKKCRPSFKKMWMSPTGNRMLVTSSKVRKTSATVLPSPPEGR